jgi:hypothetical protein
MKHFEVKLPSGELIEGLSGQDVVALAKSGRLTGDSMIRQQGQERWYRAKDVAQLATHLRTEFVGIPASLASPSPESESSPEPMKCATQRPAVIRRRRWLVAAMTCAAVYVCVTVAMYGWGARPKRLGTGNDGASTRLATGSAAGSVRALFDLTLGALTQDQEVGRVEGFELGMTYKSIAAEVNLEASSSSALIEGTTMQGGKRSRYEYEFVFDSQERLVGFGRSYYGDAQERIELLVRRFGETDKAVSSGTNAFPVSQRDVEATHVWWHFRDAVVQSFASEDRTQLCVWDKEFILEQLAVALDPRRLVLLDWVSTTFSRLREGEGLDARSGVPRGHLFDTSKKDSVTVGKWSEIMSVWPMSPVREGPWDRNHSEAEIQRDFEGGECVAVSVNMKRSLELLHDSKDPLGAGCMLTSTKFRWPEPFLSRSSLRTIFATPIVEYAVMSRFPPRDGQFTKVTKAPTHSLGTLGDSYSLEYQWSLEGGGTVQIMFDGRLEVWHRLLR